MLRRLLCSGVSQRRAAKILTLNRVTVVRKFLFLSMRAHFEFVSGNYKKPRAQKIEFDDMETFEHSKYKPLSITLAVESKTRRILGLEVSRMASKVGRPYILKKYGKPADERRGGRKRLFRHLRKIVEERVEIRSDCNPYYEREVSKYFPNSKYYRFLGKRSAATGQGELKKVRFDPLFSLNHTCAKFRADVNRLIRKTWCTTKKKDRLYAHLILYANYHNQQLT